MNGKKNQLEDFQSTMLELMSNHSSLAELQQAMRADPRLDGFRDYVESFDSDMLMIAAELTKKWGVRK